MNYTPYFFGWFHPKKASVKSFHDQLSTQSLAGLSHLFAPGFPSHLLACTQEGINSRRRIYEPRVTFWAFLWQTLNPGQSCRQTVRKVRAWFDSLKGPQVSSDDAPYCQARRRLPWATLQQIFNFTSRTAEQRARPQWRFHDRDVVVGDGTTVLLPDTPENQARFPQSARQQQGCGFPLMKVVALFSLASGALLNVATGHKHKSELGLFRALSKSLKKGVIFLADRGFCDYVTLVLLKLWGIDSLLRLNHMRPHDFRKGKFLGKHDRRVTWLKPTRKPRTISSKIWQRLADSCTLRLIRYPVLIPGFRCREIILVTTLTDAVRYPAHELAQLYARRWHVELFLRHLKTTLQMEMLSSKTPAMIRKELYMHLIGYNLVRGLMAEVAGIYEVPLERLSFKGTLDSLREFCPCIANAPTRVQQTTLINDLLSVIAQDLLPDRPHRVEPRTLKRRKKSFPLMSKPRKMLKAQLLTKYSKKHENKGP